MRIIPSVIWAWMRKGRRFDSSPPLVSCVLWSGLHPGLSVSPPDLQVDSGQAGTGQTLPAEGGGGKSL